MSGVAGYPIQLGVAISEEVYGMYSEDVQKAWEVFDTWWKSVFRGPGNLVSKKGMPSEVATAMEKILGAPIPGTSVTGENSCYMQHVMQLLTD